jgi:putative transposase
VKYEEIYLKDYLDVSEAVANLKSYFGFYNHQRPHQGLDYRVLSAGVRKGEAASVSR